MQRTGKSRLGLLPSPPTLRRAALLLVAVAACSSSPGANPGADPGVDAGNGTDAPATTPEAAAPEVAKDSGANDIPSSPVDLGWPDTGTTVETNPCEVASDAPAQTIKILAIGELVYNGQPEIHAPFVQAARPWLTQFAADNNMTITFAESTSVFSDAMLANYNLILQVNHKPFGWTAGARAAFEKYLTEGKGGWVGLHHAGLYGPAVSQEQWPWFFNFFGQINYRNYIASFAQATVHVEAGEAAHPVFKGVPASFTVVKEEWYQWDKSPRPNVHVLATVDEDTYMPNSNIKMGGDHPVVWTNDKVMGKNLYIFMGHDMNLFQNPAWVTLFKNAIFWAGTPR